MEAEHYTARLRGGYEMSTKEHQGAGLTPGVIRAGEDNALYFEALQDDEGEKIATSRRSRPIREIIAVEKQEEEQK